MNCPNCGAPMRLEENKDHLVCDFCTTTHFPEPNEDGVRILGEPDSAGCPVCRIPLIHAAVGRERILYCERCRGILVPVPLFVGLIQELRAQRDRAPTSPRPADHKELERPISCPRCSERMDTHPYAGPGNIVIDNCPGCGVNWLDHGELRRIVSAPESAYRVDYQT